MFLAQQSRGPMPAGGIPSVLPDAWAWGGTFRRWAGASVKRCLDVTLASLMLFLLMPLMAGIALLVCIDGGSVLFRHRRSGLKGRVFECLKFRTMIADAEDTFEEYLFYHPEVVPMWVSHQKLRFDPRVTAMGKLLRATSLDELPQLLNVLRGEMSLVGPRPVTVPELALYGDRLPLYEGVRPGLTGLWQVSGRNDLDFGARVDLDERYVLGAGVALDLAILARTPGVVLGRRGAR